MTLPTSWGRAPNETLRMRFTCCPNLTFLPFPWLEKYRFLNGHFADSEHFKIDIHFDDLKQVIIDYTCSFFLLSAGQSYFTELGQDVRVQQTKHRPWHKSFSVIRSWGIKNWTIQLIIRLQRFNILFLPITCFSDLCN